MVRTMNPATSVIEADLRCGKLQQPECCPAAFVARGRMTRDEKAPLFHGARSAWAGHWRSDIRDGASAGSSLRAAGRPRPQPRRLDQSAEFHMALNAGSQNIRSGGKLYVSQDEMKRCLQGGPAAFRWLQSANPRYMSYTALAGQPTYASNTSSAYVPRSYLKTRSSQYQTTDDFPARPTTRRRRRRTRRRSPTCGPRCPNPAYMSAVGRAPTSPWRRRGHTIPLGPIRRWPPLPGAATTTR